MAGFRIKEIVLPAVVLVAGFFVIFCMTAPLEQMHPRMPDSYDDSDLTFKGSRLRGFAFGSEGLIADWYYIRALQYIGDKILKAPGDFRDVDDLGKLDPRLLYPLLDNATDLDPQYIAAYTYGAVVLPAIDAAEAIQLAQKGIRNNPDSWQLYQYLGYIYWKLGQYENASRAYEAGARVSGAPQIMALMAASMSNEGGSRATARSIYSEMLHNSTDKQVQITAQRRLAELDWLEQRDVIDEALKEYRDRNGHCAASLSNILSALSKATLSSSNRFVVDTANRLVDPSGVPYLFDPNKCAVYIDTARSEVPRQ